MIRTQLLRIMISAFLYLAVCYGALWLITPLSLVNFLGPCAALFSGLLLVWGVAPLIALFLITPLVAIGMEYYFRVNINVAMMSIAMLSIILQGYWTKLLVYRFVHIKDWFISRKRLFFFLLRIGPITSIVSASSALIITMLDNQIIEGDFLYTFVSSWSTSMLMAVFFIPLLLLASNKETFKLTKLIFVIFTSILSSLAIVLLFYTSQHEQQKHREMLFEQSKLEIERLVRTKVDTIVNKLHSLSVFFNAIENVSLNEFNSFSKGLLEQDSTIRALQWAPIVLASQRKSFEKESSVTLKKEFLIKDRLDNGDMFLAKPRSQYAPLFYTYPQYKNQLALGLDVYRNIENKRSMQTIITNKKVVISAPITLVQDKLGEPSTLFTKAVLLSTDNKTSKYHPNQFEKIKKDALLGVVVAVTQFDGFFNKIAEQHKNDINFFVEDVTNDKSYILFGQKFSEINRHVDTVDIDIFSRLWRINIAETNPWFNQPKSWQAWTILIAGTLGAVFFQMLILMMTAYSNELSQKVEAKTRALILAKEISDRKNTAKSTFLNNLNNELRVPLLAIKSFIEQLKKKGINNLQVTGINYESSNIALLLDSMMDLSGIETGKITAKESVFDFYDFLQQVESVLKAKNLGKNKTIIFLVDDSVPQYINSDELFLQKLLNSLIESAHHLLSVDELRISIKLHKLADMSLFFTLSPLNPSIISSPSNNTLIMTITEAQNLAADSAVLAMAEKYSQFLGGGTNLGALSSGVGVLNGSIRVNIPTTRPQ